MILGCPLSTTSIALSNQGSLTWSTCLPLCVWVCVMCVSVFCSKCWHKLLQSAPSVPWERRQNPNSTDPQWTATRTSNILTLYAAGAAWIPQWKATRKPGATWRSALELTCSGGSTKPLTPRTSSSPDPCCCISRWEEIYKTSENARFSDHVWTDCNMLRVLLSGRAWIVLNSFWQFQNPGTTWRAPAGKKPHLGKLHLKSFFSRSRPTV